MTEPEQQAYSIYELICSTSSDRPLSFRSIEQAQSETAAWRTETLGLQPLRKAPPETLLAFLRNYKEWRGTIDPRDDLRLGASMADCVRIAWKWHLSLYLGCGAGTAAQLRHCIAMAASWVSAQPFLGAADARRDDRRHSCRTAHDAAALRTHRNRAISAKKSGDSWIERRCS